MCFNNITKCKIKTQGRTDSLLRYAESLSPKSETKSPFENYRK